MFKEKREVSVCVYMCVSYSVMSDCNHGLSMEFSRQEYWRGLPFPSPGDLPDPGIKLMPPALQAGSLPSETGGNPICWINNHKAGGSDAKESVFNAGGVVRSLGQEYPLEKRMAAHSSILAWEVRGQRSLAGYSPWGCKETDTSTFKELQNSSLVSCCSRSWLLI